MTTYYWRGGSGTWDDSTTTNWSLTSGGAGGAGVPTYADDVVFNSASSAAAYVVTCSGSPRCLSITTAAPAAGTLTFQLGTSSSYFDSAGNINVHAACVFSVGASGLPYGYVYCYYVTTGATRTITFGSSGTNTSRVYLSANSSTGGTVTTLNLCVGATSTFAGVYLVGDSAYDTINNTSAVITIANPDTTNSAAIDQFQIRSNNPVNISSSTYTMGNVTPISGGGTMDFQVYAYPSLITTLNNDIICTRAYASLTCIVSGSSVTSAALRTVTLRGNSPQSSPCLIYLDTPGTTTLTVIDCNVTGRATAQQTGLPYTITSLTLTRALMVNVVANPYGNVIGTLTFTNDATFGSLLYYSLSNLTITTLSCTATAGAPHAIGNGNYGDYAIVSSSNLSLTNTNVYTNFTLSGAATLTIASTNSTVYDFWQSLSSFSPIISMGTGAVTLTNVATVFNSAVRYSSTASASFTWNNSTLGTTQSSVSIGAVSPATAITFSALSLNNLNLTVDANITVAAGATLTTFTDTLFKGNGGYSLSVTGAGGLTSTNTYTKTYGGFTDLSGISVGSGPFTITNAPSGLFVYGPLTVGGNFSHTYSAAIGYVASNLLQITGLATISGGCTVTAPASASFPALIASLQMTSGAASFTNVILSLTSNLATGSRSFYSTGNFTVNNSTIGSSSTFNAYTIVACSAFSINNVSTQIGVSNYGTLEASSSTSYTAGTYGSTFTLSPYSQSTSFGALTTNGGSLTINNSSGTGEIVTATTITTTNTTLSMVASNVTATGAVSITGDAAGTNSATFSVLIGSSTVSFTNVSPITIAGNSVYASGATHTLKGTTLTVNNSALTSPNTTGSSITVGTNNSPPITFTGLATFNNVAATFGTYYDTNPVVTFVGLTMTKGTFTNTGVTFAAGPYSLLTHSIGALTATTGGTITAGLYLQINSGAVTATNVFFDCGQAAWTAAGTVAIASSPTSATNTASFNYFINGAFTTTFTSYDVSFSSASPSGASAGAAFYSTGNLVLDDSGRSSAGTFTALSGTIVFVTGAGVTTWTKKYVQTQGITATGAGGLTLTSASSSDGSFLLASGGTVAITGPFTLTNQKSGNFALSCYNLTVGGAFVANNSAGAGAGTYVALANAASVTGTTTLTKVGLTAITYTGFGAMSCTGEGSANSNPDNTFQITSSVAASGTSNLTIADYYNVSLGNVTAGGSLSFTHASQLVNATCTGNITQSQVAGTTTITRVRLSGSSSSTFTSNGTMTMSTSAAVHGFLTISGAAVTSNAGSGNYSCISAGDITFTGAVALTNTNLWASSYVASGGTGAITITGGASKPFSFTIDANAIPLDSYTSTFNIDISGTYPGMTFNSFTLSNTGSTFSVTSATTYKRPLICFDQSSSTSAVISIPSGVTPTLTNVDFWRITPGGTSTKPWTGTSLGRVGGTIANLTTTAPKSVYYVGGAGSWEGAKWATSSGGTGATANYPLPQDNINFDANSGGGTVTVPASIRIGSLFLASTSPGLTRISPLSTGSSVAAEIWVCSGISGPPTDPGIANLFYLGDNTSTTPTVAFVDGGSSDTITVTNSQNMAIASAGFIRYNNAGTLNLPEVYYVGLTTPTRFGPLFLYNTNAPVAIDASTRVVNLTASTFTIYQGQIAQGTFNLGSCTISADSFRIYSGTVAIPSTPYTCNVNTSYTLNATVTESIGGSNAAHLGKLVYAVNTSGPSFSSTVNDPTFLSVVVSDSTSATITFRIAALGSTRRLYTLSTFNVTNNSGGTFNFTNTTGAAITLNGVAGARNQWTNIVIGSATASARINASPASPATWYYSGGSLGAGQTGWNAGTAPATNTGFFFF